MPSLAPFHSDLDDIKAPLWDPSQEELKQKRQDEDDMEQMIAYRNRFTDQWLRSAKAWNLLSEPIADPKVSNVVLPIARMIASTGIAAMSEGRPSFGFRPGASSDYAKVALWKAAVDGVLSESNFEAQQNTFLTDFSVTGTGIYEAFVQTPMRTMRDDNGTERLVRDYRKPKLGVRARGPWECGIHPGARTPDEAPSCFFVDHMPYDVFVQDYARCFLANGKEKYKNTQFVRPGMTTAIGKNDQMEFRESEKTGVSVVTYQNQIKDILRIYANGVLILDKPLRSANILGMTTLCFGPNNDQYDSNLQTHSLWGMGDPHLVRGLDALYQAFGNMTVDNWKLANSVALAYKPLNNASTLDIDNIDFYSGTIIEGEIISSPLGRVNMNDYQGFKEILDEWCIWTTGIDFKQLQQDGVKTAFELSQRIQAQNRRFEYKIHSLESGCFLKLGRLLLANVMSDLTVEDYEAITDKDLSTLKVAIDSGKIAKEDLVKEDGNIVGRKVRSYIRVPGRAYSETLGKDGKRKLDYNSADNTLTEDVSKRGKQDSFVPAVGEYLWSDEYIIHNGIPDVYVEGQHMLGDLRFEKLDKWNQIEQDALQQYQLAAQQIIPAPNYDMEKINQAKIRALDIKEDEVMKTGDDSQGKIKNALNQLKQLSVSPPPNAQMVPQAPPVNAARSPLAAGAGASPQAPQQNPAGSLA